MTQNSGVEPIGDEALNGLVGFTPGPWEPATRSDNDRDVVTTFAPNGRLGKCLAWLDHDYVSVGEAFANHLLMAAAPAMQARILADRTRIAELEAENAGLREKVCAVRREHQNYLDDIENMDATDLRLLSAWSRGSSDFSTMSFAHIAEYSGLPIETVRKRAPVLRELGCFVYHRTSMTEDGEPYGAGYAPADHMWPIIGVAATLSAALSNTSDAG